MLFTLFPDTNKDRIQRQETIMKNYLSGELTFSVISNDIYSENQSESNLLCLYEMTVIFQTQLPKMPKEYIFRQVFDIKHKTFVLFYNKKPVGGICYRPFYEVNFAEIVFCAVDGESQVKGFGGFMMDGLKEHIKAEASLNFQRMAESKLEKKLTISKTDRKIEKASKKLQINQETEYNKNSNFKLDINNVTSDNTSLSNLCSDFKSNENRCILNNDTGFSALNKKKIDDDNFEKSTSNSANNNNMNFNNDLVFSSLNKSNANLYNNTTFSAINKADSHLKTNQDSDKLNDRLIFSSLNKIDFNTKNNQNPIDLNNNTKSLALNRIESDLKKYTNNMTLNSGTKSDVSALNEIHVTLRPDEYIQKYDQKNKISLNENNMHNSADSIICLENIPNNQSDRNVQNIKFFKPNNTTEEQNKSNKNTKFEKIIGAETLTFHRDSKEYLEKQYKTRSTSIYLLTYADNYAIGYFKKNGFSNQIKFKGWIGYIKDYDGGTLMQCKIYWEINYLKKDQFLTEMKTKTLKRLSTMSEFMKKYEGFGNKKIGSIADIPGVKSVNVEEYIKNRKSRNENLNNILKFLVSDLQANSNSWPFLHPVKTEEVPDYYHIIKSPMDLETMEKKIESVKYFSLKEFEADFRQMIKNCYTYNAPTTLYYKCAQNLEDYYDEKIKFFQFKDK